MHQCYMSKIKLTQNNESRSLNIKWLSFFLIALAIAAPWVNTSTSNPAFVKSYVASFGITILTLMSLYYKCDGTPVHLKINHIKLSLLLLLLFGTLSVFWSANIDFTITKWLLWLNVALSFILAINLTIDKKNMVKLALG